MELSIRPETPDDFATVFEIHCQAFGRDGEARLVEALRREPGHRPMLSLLAEKDDVVLGHILFSPILVRTERGARPAVALGPVGVLPAHQRGGVGKALVRGGLDACREAGETRVIVVGHPSYYPRFGFVPAARWKIRAPFPVPDDAFMACELAPGALDGYTGEVEYPAPFSEVE